MAGPNQALDCYRVEVLHMLNPHLIWLDVRDPNVVYENNGIQFEQIGIYGMLPLETTIALDNEQITVQRCEDWVPAATVLIWEFLKNEKEVYFIPIHLDRRSTIFDDYVHKFGDLVVKKGNGQIKSVIKVLKNSGFANYDVTMFHQFLSLGKINTKLSNIETLDVITELEKYFIRKNVPKDYWELPIKQQTCSFRASYNYEQALTITNLDKHNKYMKSILDGKNKALELCKGADELSAGRGSTRRGKEENKSALEKKFELMKNKKTRNSSIDSDTTENKSNEHLQAFEDTKMLVDANAAPYSMKIYSKTDPQKVQILSKVLNKQAKQISERVKLINKLFSETIELSSEVVEEPMNSIGMSISSTDQASTTNLSQVSEQEDILNKSNNIQETNCVSVEIAASISKPVQNELDKNDNHIVRSQQNGNNEILSTKSKQESSDKIQEPVVETTLHEEQDRSNVSKNVDYNHRRSTKGKSGKKGAKALKLESRESPSQMKHGARNRSISPLQKLAYPTRIIIRESDLRNTKRVPDLPDNSEAHPAKPISEQMVKNLMSTFKLTGSKHSEMNESAVRKCSDGGSNNPEAIAALCESRNTIIQNKTIEEIQGQGDAKNLATISYDVPPMQTASKNKPKKKAKKQSDTNVQNKIVYGPPGIDVNTLSRVPTVVVCGKEMTNNGNTIADEDVIDSSGVNNNPGPSCSYANKVPVNRGSHEKEINTKRNEIRQEKDTSSSSSSMWEKRLKLHNEMAKNKRSTSHSSDTTNKDSSNPEENTQDFTKQNVDEVSDDSISDSIVEKLGIGYNSHVPNPDKNNESIEHILSKQTVRANPFQNYDDNLSVFVDKLVTPIMMVHSKINKVIVPTSSFRDIHFTDHIRSVLKNLHVYHPKMLQSISWNAILRGYSVFMVGSTFSGKTMGYLPAVCRHVTDYHQSESVCNSVGPFCIIVCATSYSVTEIARIAKMLVGCDEKVVFCHYGYDEVAIATSLLNGCDLLVTTAPSLVRLLQMSDYGVDLQRLVTFVLDDCERLSEVYPNEIKFCMHKVREITKSRVNQGFSVQYIGASRIWCDLMESLAKKAPDALVCIGAFQECILYAKANMTVSYVKKSDKLNCLLGFLKDVDPSKRTVVVCDTDEEVDFLKKAVSTDKYLIFATNSTMTVQDLYNLTLLWKEFREPMVAPVLICCDTNLYHMNVVDASYLVQYSMPSQYSIFCRRFATLNESYPSIFKSNNDSNIKILILLDENNVDQLPKIIHFVKRCTNNVPGCLDDICAAILAQKDVRKAENCAPLCTNMMSYGDCPDLHYCISRHTILKDYDKPKEWMPKSGIVTFKILHYHTATCYSARLIGYLDAETHYKYPSTYSNMSLKMGMHYAKSTNRIALGIPKVGDVCAVALKHNLFCRAQVLKVSDGKGNVKNVLVHLFDEEIIETTSDIDLYHLPDDLRRDETYVVQVRLANIQPRDKDLVFSQLATDQIKEAISVKENVFMKGRIVLTVANCIFVDTLDACQDLKSLKETVVIYNVKRELLEKHAEINPDHLPKIEEFCRKAELEVKPPEKKENESRPVVKVKPEISWAHIEEDMAMVEIGAVKNPNTIFVRLTKFDDCMKNLLLQIEKHLSTNEDILENFVKDDIVLAAYPDDNVYERARIDEIGDINIKCFFVDQGEWRQITKDKIKSISDSLITQLPFQTIECRLVGIQPPGDQWTDFATNWLFDRCSEPVTGTSKQLYVKYYTKEPAQYTGGYKYGVSVIDTYGDEDIVLNQVMIDLNLAKEVNDEIKYLDHGKFKNESEATCKEVEDDDYSWENESIYPLNSYSTPNKAMTKLIRSVPLVETDDDSDCSELWNINVTEDMARIFKYSIKDPTQDKNLNVPAVESNKAEVIEENKVDNCTSHPQEVKINPDSSKDLDSDDLSSPETVQSTTEASETVQFSSVGEQILPLNQCQMRKPKLNWRQTRTNVTIKILLIGADTYDLQIHDRALTFGALVNDTNYGFEFELYGVIDKKTASHSYKGQYILVKLNKIMHKNWLTLTKDGGIEKWIVYDVDSIDTSSDEEEVQNDNLYNIVKNVINNTDTDSDEDVTYGAVDDVNFKY